MPCKQVNSPCAHRWAMHCEVVECSAGCSIRVVYSCNFQNIKLGQNWNHIRGRALGVLVNYSHAIPKPKYLMFVFVFYIYSKYSHTFCIYVLLKGKEKKIRPQVWYRKVFSLKFCGKVGITENKRSCIFNNLFHRITSSNTVLSPLSDILTWK